MNQLALIESRIKELFEKNSDRLPWTDTNAGLVRQLCSALQEYLVESPETLSCDVSSIRIFLSARDLGRWQQEPAWQTLLSDAVTETLIELKCKPIVMPDLQLVARNSLQDGEILFAFEQNLTSQEQTGVVKDLANHAPIEQSKTEIPSAFLTLEDESLVPIQKNVLNVGRHSENDLVLSDPRVSRKHAQIRKTRQGFMVFDVGSKGGTFVNNERVTTRPLQSGDVLSLAGYHLLFTEEIREVEIQREKTAEILVQNQSVD